MQQQMNKWNAALRCKKLPIEEVFDGDFFLFTHFASVARFCLWVIFMHIHKEQSRLIH